MVVLMWSLWAIFASWNHGQIHQNTCREVKRCIYFKFWKKYGCVLWSLKMIKLSTCTSLMLSIHSMLRFNVHRKRFRRNTFMGIIWFWDVLLTFSMFYKNKDMLMEQVTEDVWLTPSFQLSQCLKTVFLFILSDDDNRKIMVSSAAQRLGNDFWST